MERNELIERLKGYEWSDIEFKRAQRDVPQSAYETVSAFSNTEGGWLVFGVKDGAGDFEIVGVLEVDKVQNDFLSALRSGQKLNRVVTAKEHLIEDDGKALLIFHIPEARRHDKPVYLNGDIRKSFIRRGAGDEQCTEVEIERLLRDASDERYDGESLDLDPECCFDIGSVHWYRKLFEDRNPGYDSTQTHLEFLHHWGLVVEMGGRLRPTRAAILLFGAAPALRQELPRPVVDWQWSRGESSEELADERWSDRLIIEDNLVETWKALVDRYLHRAEKPFSVDPETLRREDIPPDYVAFRETAINLLIHQDYADHTRKPTIRFFDDRTIFWNPGDGFLSKDELFEPGEREVRNPRIVGAFRRIGLSEQAGTGIRAIFNNWGQLGHVPPIIENDKARKAFQLTLLKEELLSKEQLLFQASLGVRLNDAEAKAFAFACREGELRQRDVHAVTGLSGTDARAILGRLSVQGLVLPLEAAETPVFVVAEHLREQIDQRYKTQPEQQDLSTIQVDPPSTNLVTDQVDPELSRLVTDQASKLQELDGAAWKIVMFCDVPRSMADIMGELGLTHRTFFRRNHLDPLLASGVMRMTHPDQPNHPDQAYVLTEAGAALKVRHMSGSREMDNGNRSNGA